jgi:hypothetical protein
MEDFSILSTSPTRAHKGTQGWQVETSHTLSGSPERVLKISTYKQGQQLQTRASIHKVIGEGMLEHVIGFHGRRAGDFRKVIQCETVKMVTERLATAFHEQACRQVTSILAEATEHYLQLLEAAVCKEMGDA